MSTAIGSFSAIKCFLGADDCVPCSFAYFTNHVTALAEFPDRLQHCIGVLFTDDKNHAEPIVESTIHFIWSDRADFLNHREYRGHRPALLIDHCTTAVRQHPRQISTNAAASDMRRPFNRKLVEEHTSDFYIDPRRFEQLFRQGATEFWNLLIDLEAPSFQKHFACQRVAITMETRRRQTDQNIPWNDFGRIYYFPPFQDADNEPRKIILAVGKIAGMFGGFSANQRTTGRAATCGDPAHHRFGNFDVELATDKIIQKKKRRRSLGQNIVDPHRHEIDSHRVMNPSHECNLEFGPDAVSGGNQDRIAMAGRLEIEQRAEAADTGQYAGRSRFFSDGCNAAHQRVTGFDTDAGLGVG